MVELGRVLRDLVLRRGRHEMDSVACAPERWRDAGGKLRALGPAPSILVVKLDHIGDFITALPACERLKAAFPASRLALLCGSYNRALAETTGLFDAIHTHDFLSAVEQTPRRASMADAAALATEALPAYDVVVDLRHDDDARLLLWGINAKVRVAFAGDSRAYPLDIALPEMEVSGRVSGLYPPVGAATRLELLVEALVSAHRAALLGYEGPLGQGAEIPFPDGYVVMGVGSRLPIKQWFPECWAELAAALVARTTLGIVLVGGKEEQEDSARVAAGLPPERVCDLTGRRPLSSAPGLLRGARAFIGLDSGLSHMAASLSVPTVVLFSGFAEANVWVPRGPRAAVLHTDIACAPCFLASEELCTHARLCMRALTPAMVLQALADVAADPALKALAAPDARRGDGPLAIMPPSEQEGAGSQGAPGRDRRVGARFDEVAVTGPATEGPAAEGLAAEGFAAEQEPEVTVVFVTYNSSSVIGQAVGSVPASCAVVIVDNDSPEGTFWSDVLPRPADLVRMPKNLGFGSACNAGARQAKSRYVLFLNPDAALAPGAIEALLDAAGRYGEPVLLMPTIVGENGRPMRKEGTVFEPVPRSARLSVEEVAGDYCTRFVHGAAFMMERARFLDLGGFDEAIFLYHEDDDLSLRAIAHNIPITVIADAKVVHAGGGSSTRSLSHTFRVNRAKKRSELYLHEKYGRPRSRLRDAAYLGFGCLLAALMLNPHRFMIRAGKLAGVLEPPSYPRRPPRL